MWIVRREYGWVMLDYTGNFLNSQSFMCSCKGHAMTLNLAYIIISDRSPKPDLESFTKATNIVYEFIEEAEATNYF